MVSAIAEQGLGFESEELGLLSRFFQNAQTLCQVLAGEMRDKQVRDYGSLLESLAHSLDHAWPLVASLEEKGEASLKDINACVEKVNAFLEVVRAHRELSLMDKQELSDAVGGLQKDVADFGLEEEKVHQLVNGIKVQLKKIVDLLSENLKGFTSKSLEVLKEMVERFEVDFSKLLEKEGAVKAHLVEGLNEFLREKAAESVGLLAVKNAFTGIKL